MEIFLSEIRQIQAVMAGMSALRDELVDVAIGDFHLYDTNGEDLGYIRVEPDNVVFVPTGEPA